jgi:putative ABC transport system permease protein
MNVRPTLLMLSGATALLMLIACVNLAMLMLGEVTRRQPELTARAALGAAPGRLSRQLLAETLVVSGSAALLGVAVGWALTRILLAMAPAGITGLGAVRFDFRVFGFVTLAAVVAGTVSGVLPVIAILRWRRYGAGGVGGQTARGEVRIQRLLVGTEVALCLVMLVGCSLLGRALLKLSAIDPGFASDGLVAVDLIGPRQLWADSAAALAFETAAIRELGGIPGVARVSGSNQGLFNGHWSSSPIRVVGPGGDSPEHPVMQHVVLPGYFKTMGVPIAIGRDFSEGDLPGAAKVAIISAAEAKRDFSGVSPIGKLVKWQSEKLTVVGVAADVHYTQLDNEDQPTIYVPSAQWAGEWMSYVVRASGATDASLLIHTIRDRLVALNPTVSIQSIALVPALVRRSYAEEQYRTLLGSLFGMVGTVLAAFGMFGVISRTVARRMREAGIRSALGAPAYSITMVMLRETGIGALFGLGAGLLMAAYLAKGLTPYLHGIPSFDPVAYGVALGAFVVAAGIATVPAASKAARVDPARVLRAEG